MKSVDVLDNSALDALRGDVERWRNDEYGSVEKAVRAKAQSFEGANRAALEQLRLAAFHDAVTPNHKFNLQHDAVNNWPQAVMPIVAHALTLKGEIDSAASLAHERIDRARDAAERGLNDRIQSALNASSGRVVNATVASGANPDRVQALTDLNGVIAGEIETLSDFGRANIKPEYDGSFSKAISHRIDELRGRIHSNNDSITSIVVGRQNLDIIAENNAIQAEINRADARQQDVVRQGVAAINNYNSTYSGLQHVDVLGRRLNMPFTALNAERLPPGVDPDRVSGATAILSLRAEFPEALNAFPAGSTWESLIDAAHTARPGVILQRTNTGWEDRSDLLDRRGASGVGPMSSIIPSFSTSSLVPNG